MVETTYYLPYSDDGSINHGVDQEIDQCGFQCWTPTTPPGSPDTQEGALHDIEGGVVGVQC